ncbi:RND family transporter [Pelomonas sp. KK5]|uniref:efflux RND transporter permease subunit n=1 Tax=Pelomonas sp. KK5 TaxID=1855730 RepID=UPI00097C27C1|nr:efflux RND transporter permease subunit [Pelomonas sp. KK5]
MSASKSSPRFVERCADLLIHWRRPLLAVFIGLTLLFGASATRLTLDPGFTKMIPVTHPYMKTFIEYASTFTGANRVLVELRWKGPGDMYNKAFLDTLRKATDEVFFIPGVSRSGVQSLFTPNVRYIEVTEQGFVGDVVVPARFDGSAEALATVRANVQRSGQIGGLVASDLKGALVRADLLDVDPQTGRPLDYRQLSARLEEVRMRLGSDQVEVHIVGFAKVVGDVIEGLGNVIAFFAIAFAITAALLYGYSRSLKLTAVALAVALLPVVWLLGLLPLLGLGIDPMSILVPFLIFSIGVSHAVQMSNAWKQEVQAGRSAEAASHAAFRKLFVPGALALLTNALGFAVIMHIDIPIVHELGITACLGVLLMIVTNKLMLPIVLSHLKLGGTEAAPREARARHPLWWAVSACAERRVALFVFAVSLALLAIGALGSRQLKTGDVGNGAPELRADSRYNRDNAQIVARYGVGVDVLSVIVETRGFDGDACLHYPVMNAIERFELFMRGVAGVHSVSSVTTAARVAIAANNEGSPRWAALPRNAQALAQGASGFNPDAGLNTDGCKAIQVLVYTQDHEGATIAHLVREIDGWIAANPVQGVSFRLAAGNVGVMAATNEAVEHAEVTMLVSIFGAIALLCLLTFRSWTAVLCIIVPLAIVSILCNALMASLGIGLKVATLPVVALGVGVGVDYGIYLFERIQHHMADGEDFREAFYRAMCERGTAAVFTALTMSIGVATWAFSALKFQADMGLLLAFMFLVNVFGAILLLPALGAWFNAVRPAALPVKAAATQPS